MQSLHSDTYVTHRSRVSSNCTQCLGSLLVSPSRIHFRSPRLSLTWVLVHTTQSRHGDAHELFHSFSLARFHTRPSLCYTNQLCPSSFFLGSNMMRSASVHVSITTSIGKLIITTSLSIVIFSGIYVSTSLSLPTDVAVHPSTQTYLRGS
jgi:hypothetical protein